MSNNKKEVEYPTIKEYFDGYLDIKEARIIKVMPIELWAKSQKQLARIKILLPEEICGDSLRDLDKWFLSIVAIPKEVITK